MSESSGLEYTQEDLGFLAESLSAETIATAQKVFYRYDLDKNGVMDMKELGSLMSDMAIDPESSRGQALLQLIDEEGVLNFVQFVNAHSLWQTDHGTVICLVLVFLYLPYRRVLSWSAVDDP